MAVVKNLIVRGGADFSSMQKEFRKAQSSMTTFGNKTSKILKGINVAIGGFMGYQFFKSAIEESNQAESAMIGLNSILNAQGKSTQNASNFINEYIKDGLIPLTDAISGYKNLLMAGFDDKQIQDTLGRLKDSSAFARQGTLTMGEAVRGATEGIKNQNSMMIDNAGVTKNLSVMYKEYAKQIGKSSGSLTEQEKILATYQGIMKETRFQVGDANRVAQTFQGRIAGITQKFKAFKVIVGNGLKPILNALLPILDSLLTKLIEIATVFSNITTSIFGKPIMDTKATVSSSDAIEEMGDATEEAGKQAKKAVMGFDEINLLDAESGAATDGSNISTSIGTETTESTEPVIPQTTPLIEALKTIKNAWGEYFSSSDTEFAKFKETLKLVFGDIKLFMDEHGIGIVTWLSETGLYLFDGFFKILNTIILYKDEILVVLGALGAAFLVIKGIQFTDGIITGFTKIAPYLTGTKSLTDLLGLSFFGAGGKAAGLSTSLLGFKGILGLLTSPIGLIIAGIALLVGAFIYLWNTNNEFKEDMKKIWAEITEVFKVFWEDTIKPLFGLINDYFIAPLVHIFKEYLAPILGFVFKLIGKYIVNWLASFVAVVTIAVGLIEWFVKAWAEGYNKTKFLLSGLEKLFTGDFKGALDDFGKYFKSLFAWIGNLFVDFINAFVKGWNVIAKLQGKSEVKLLSRFEYPDQPKETKPKGGAGRSIVDPDEVQLPAKGGVGRSFSDIGSNINTKNITTQDDLVAGFGSMLTQTGTPAGSQSTGDWVVEMDGQKVGRIVKPHIDNENKRIGTKLVTSS